MKIRLYPTIASTNINDKYYVDLEVAQKPEIGDYIYSQQLIEVINKRKQSKFGYKADIDIASTQLCFITKAFIGLTDIPAYTVGPDPSSFLMYVTEVSDKCGCNNYIKAFKYMPSVGNRVPSKDGGTYLYITEIDCNEKYFEIVVEDQPKRQAVTVSNSFGSPIPVVVNTKNAAVSVSLDYATAMVPVKVDGRLPVRVDIDDATPVRVQMK